MDANNERSQFGKRLSLTRRHKRVDLLCLGCANFGGFGSNPDLVGRGDSEKYARRLMDRSWDLGVRWFDTADAYASGESESIIGRWMRSTGKRPMLTTKTFNPMLESGDRGLQPRRIERQLVTSLQRLGVGEVEMYLAHEFDSATSVEATISCLENCKRRGYIGGYGVSNFDFSQLDAYASIGNPRIIQNSYSLLDRKDESSVLSRAYECEIAYQAYSALAGGWLTGKYRPGQQAPGGSRMSLRPEPYPSLESAHVHGFVAGVEREAAARSVSAAGLALAWVLGNPLVASVVVGPRRPEQFDVVYEALSLELGADERDRIGGRLLDPSAAVE